jgi:Na+/H+ antiporter NhaD/arsenite permease-like protein
MTVYALRVTTILALSVFIIAYGYIATEKFNRVAIALVGAAAMVIVGATDADAAFFSHETGIDWNVIFLLLGMMIIVSVIHKTGFFEYLAIKAIKLAKGNPKGVMKTFADFLKDLVGSNVTLAAMSLLGVSAVLSGIVDNIPYVASMSPVVMELSKSIPESAGDVLWWALAFGADFGGNATIIGASTNVVAVGLAKKAGIHISFWQFAKYGIPVTLLSVIMVVPYLLLRYL